MNYDNQYRPSGFGYLPVVTKNILIINVLLFFATELIKASKGIDLSEYLGLHFYSASNFKPHQFVTYIFMHGSFQHILFNMFGVYIFGQVLEQVWGPKRYLIFYLVTGFGAAIAQYIVMSMSIGPVLESIQAVQNNLQPATFEALLNKADFQSTLSFDFSATYNEFVQKYNNAILERSPRAMALASQFLIDYKNQYLNSHVIIGASGSLFGLLGAFGMLFPNRYLYLYFFFPIKAKWLVTAYGAIELFSGLQNNPEDNVAHFAHLGGLFVGIIMVLIWRKDRTQFY